MHCEISATYIAKVIRKVQAQYRSAAPSQGATDDFNDLVDGYFEDKTFTDNCRSWFKPHQGKSRVVIGWPGTAYHCFSILRDPRWEDFVFERRRDAARNRYEYFGNGNTAREQRNELLEITQYFKEVGKEDLATLHENWNE